MAKDFVVGVDVGGQTTKIGVVDTRGEVLSQTIIRSDIFGDDAAAYITALAAAIKENIAQAGKTLDDIRGIGVGAPNGNYYTGEVAFAPNLAWAANKAVPFARMLSEALGGEMKVILTNDTNATAVRAAWRPITLPSASPVRPVNGWSARMSRPLSGTWRISRPRISTTPPSSAPLHSLGNQLFR